MSDSNPSISVVIPCFRAGALLAEAVESVLAQTETDWELILVDNNASEETKEVIFRFVRKYPDKIRSVCELEQGSSSARNRGIMEAHGFFVAFLDDDDQMYPDRLSLQKEALLNREDAVLCFGGIDGVSHDGRRVVRSGARDADFPFFPESGDQSKDFPRLRFPEPRPSSVMVRRSLAEKFGGVDRHFNPFFTKQNQIKYDLFPISGH